MLQHLEEHGIPVPNYVLVNRAFPFENIDYFIEEEDYIEVKGKRIFKPFVEKPTDGNGVIKNTYHYDFQNHQIFENFLSEPFLNYYLSGSLLCSTKVLPCMQLGNETLFFCICQSKVKKLLCNFFYIFYR